MRAVVTGATGCIGSALCRELKTQGWRVKALVRPGRGYDHIAPYLSEVHLGDVSAAETLRGLSDDADVVFHLAARVTDHGSRGQFFDSILTGTRNMLQASSCKARRFVQVSSTTACGVGMHLRGRREDDLCLQSGIPYADAKLAAERLAAAHAGIFAAGVTIVRPSNVVGPGSPYVDELCRRFRSPFGVPLVEGGRYSASLVYVDNLVDGMILAGTHPEASGRTYHFCDDWRISWKRYLSDLSALLGARPRGDIPFRLAWAAGRFFETVCPLLGRRPPVTRLAAAIMGRDNHVDTSRARKELGWRTKVTYTEAIQKISVHVDRVSRG